jgi:hypothetical protein
MARHDSVKEDASGATFLYIGADATSDFNTYNKSEDGTLTTTSPARRPRSLSSHPEIQPQAIYI